MTMELSTDTIRRTLKTGEILEGNFGLEKEGVRIDEKAHLATTPHPAVFGDKLENPYITTDFSESQIEIVTPTFNTIDKTHEFLSLITDIVNENIKENEYIWAQSLPPIIPGEDQIPTAVYNKSPEGQQAEEYRKKLAKKYGKKKQLISGIHYNYSLKDETIKKLHNSNKNIPYREFKNQIYLKITRNYLRYRWFVIYITGASPAAHESFTEEYPGLTTHRTPDGSHYSIYATSLRNSSYGYKNMKELYPRYDTVENFTEDINRFVDNGELSDPKELYSQIRLKPEDRNNLTESLLHDGIQYLEIRTIDLNPFKKEAITKKQMKFLHLFIIYMLVKDENNYPEWQQEGFENEQTIAKHAFKKDAELHINGDKIPVKQALDKITHELSHINRQLELNYDDIINYIEEKVENPGKTYPEQLIKTIQKHGFIQSQLQLAKKYKKQSNTTKKLEENPQYMKYYKQAIKNSN